jgi:hypothetical protein
VNRGAPPEYAVGPAQARTVPPTNQARAVSVNRPDGEPSRRKHASRRAARLSSSSDAQYAPDGPIPVGNGERPRLDPLQADRPPQRHELLR